MSRGRATLIGFSAVLMWSLLALLTIGTAPVPPLQLNAICFAIGGGIGLIWVARGAGFGVFKGVGWKVYAFGTAGLFGYHAIYFTAFRLAAQAGVQAQVGLIAYLWPLLIVLLSGLLPGEHLRRGHVIGALVAFAGAALIVLRSGGGAAGTGAAPALLLAFLCALTWAGYSVVSRRLGEVPSETVVIFCLATAALSLPVHLAVETTQWPVDPWGWLCVAALGIGVAVGSELWLSAVPPGTKANDVRAVQGLGVASVVVVVVAAAGAVIGAVIGLQSDPEP